MQLLKTGEGKAVAMDHRLMWRSGDFRQHAAEFMFGRAMFGGHFITVGTREQYENAGVFKTMRAREPAMPIKLREDYP
jgi:hypothetical protein